MKVLNKNWKEILWGSKEETAAEQFNSDADPADLSIENAYKTRWIWYHTILGLLMLMANMVLLAIFLLLAIKL
tara:strand:+ start:3864 stop:4082 length:219 start_codon:yes stop_codon:yes gene_type:complete